MTGTMDFKGRTEACLAYVIELVDDPLGDRLRGCWMGDVARRISGSTDCRKISWPIRELVEIGLLERLPNQHLLPTERGRHVDEVLREVTAARGGEFKPLVQTDLSRDEILVIKRRR